MKFRKRRTDMKRLTGRRDGRAYIVGCPDFALPKIAGLIIQQTVDRLSAIEDILGDEYELDRLRELVEADRMIGQEVWAQEKYLKIFREKSSLIQRTTIQYISLLKGGDILCHTKTCAFPLNEIGGTVFSTLAEAEEALRREQDGAT